MPHTKERFRLFAATYIMLVRAGKIFLLRRFNTGWMDGKYTLPAGHIEENETVRQATIRETEEEAGIKIKNGDLRCVHVMHRYSLQPSGVSVRVYIDFFFTVDGFIGIPAAIERERSDRGEWFPLDNLPDNILLYVKVAIENYKKNIPYSEFGWQ